MTFREFITPLRWIDGRPLLEVIEPYRLALLERFNERDGDGRLNYNLGLFGRAKKNWKTADLVVDSLYGLFDDAPAGNQGYIAANDEDQADDDLVLVKKIRAANPLLMDWTTVKRNVIERKDGKGFLEILPAQDAVGQHGKTFRKLHVDEIHGYRNWDLLEALAPDPSRPDCQTYITSYASIYHKPGIPLFDLMRLGRKGEDPRMLFSWYAADFTTDPAFAELGPEERANPSMASWGNDEYLAQQRRRLPAHKFRRLHLNLPGLPEGSAFQAEPIMDAVDRGVTSRPFEFGHEYRGFVDMSGGSNDDATLGIAHRDRDGRVVLDLLVNQGPPPPFDPNSAVERFARILKHDYRLSTITLDRYAGLTFIRQFERLGINCRVSDLTASELYEAFEPDLNARRVRLLDVPTLEQQLLGLVWKGSRITHESGEHDDWANCCAGAISLVTRTSRVRVGMMHVPWL